MATFQETIMIDCPVYLTDFLEQFPIWMDGKFLSYSHIVRLTYFNDTQRNSLLFLDAPAQPITSQKKPICNGDRSLPRVAYKASLQVFNTKQSLQWCKINKSDRFQSIGAFPMNSLPSLLRKSKWGNCKTTSWDGPVIDVSAITTISWGKKEFF